MSFWNSPLLKNLESGELPEVKVLLSPQTLMQLAIAIMLAGVLIISFFFLMKSIAK
jgi:hypothetical protein